LCTVPVCRKRGRVSRSMDIANTPDPSESRQRRGFAGAPAREDALQEAPGHIAKTGQRQAVVAAPHRRLANPEIAERILDIGVEAVERAWTARGNGPLAKTFGRETG